MIEVVLKLVEDGLKSAGLMVYSDTDPLYEGMGLRVGMFLRVHVVGNCVVVSESINSGRLSAHEQIRGKACFANPDFVKDVIRICLYHT